MHGATLLMHETKLENSTEHQASALGVNTDQISKNALTVVKTLQDNGYQAYLVGGCVRDLILGRQPKDFDVATDATPEQTKKAFRNARIIGRRFRLVHVRYGYEVIEVATFRAGAEDREQVGEHEMSQGDQGQLLRDNVYGSIEEDVLRRDFRANALYYDPQRDLVLDFVGGVEDIQQQKLVSIGDPKQRFTEDPVRMLRVVRFAAKLGFSMEEEAKQMIEDDGKLLSHVSSARLFEEVLKLFHGGAAFDTYMMLREYGLFKYLFPFTDQSVLENVEGMPERALKNTDKRIHAGKPVIPAFLFACMLWDPVKADAQLLMQDGTPENQAWRIAMADALRDQNQYVAVPRRLADIILDIWNIHFRLIKRNPRMIKASLNNRRFRAAYDFLLLRVTLHEVDEELGEWWTQIQEVDAAEREEMITELGQSYKQQRQAKHADGETNGNSINYTPQEANGNVGNQRGSQNHSNRKQNGRKKTKAGQKRRRNQANSHFGGNGQAQANPNQRAANGQKRNGKKRPNRRRKSQARGQNEQSRAYANSSVNAQPRDDLGNYQLADQADSAKSKKVKVRRKRRIPSEAEESKPHF